MREDPDREQEFMEDLVAQVIAQWALEGSAALVQVCAANPTRAAALRALVGPLVRTGLISDQTGPAESADELRTIGAFTIQRRLGAGAMGEVFLAQQRHPRRLVALKVLRPDHRLYARARERFRREIEAVGALDHPGICALFEAGESDGVPYLAMRFVDGETLAQRILRGPATTSTEVSGLLEVGEKLAFALHHAHEHGLVHRDVKPANIMIDPEGEPVLLDFGLARDSGKVAATLTASGEMVGTPAYMSPEQIAGARVDRQADVYALGATLYEAFTGRRPHEAPNLAALRRKILESDVVPIARKDRAFPRDVGVVVATAMEKDLARRYGTALDLAEDLRRIRERRPIAARPAGPWLRLRRWGGRRPGLAVALGAIFLFLIAGMAASLTALDAIRGEQRTTSAALRRTRVSGLVQASELARLRSPIQALLLARRAFGLTRNESTRSAMVAALANMQQAASLKGHSDDVLGVVLVPDGGSFVSFSKDGTARQWGLDGEPVAEFLHGGPIVELAFAPSNPELMVTASTDGTARVWRLGEGASGGAQSDAEVSQPIEVGAPVTSVAFDPLDAARLVTASTDGVARLWKRDGAQWSQIREFQGSGGAMTCVRLAPDGRRLLTCSVNGSARLWSVPTGEYAPLDGHGGTVSHGEFSSDGSRMATASHSGRVGLWDGEGAQIAWLKEHEYAVLHVTFDDEGRLLSTSRDGSVAVHDGDGGVLLDRLRGHGGGVLSASVSRDGQFVLTSSGDGIVRIFGRDGRLRWSFRGHEGYVWDAEFLQGTSLVASASRDGTVALFDARGGPVPTMIQPSGRIEGIVVGHGGKRLYTGGNDGQLRVWGADARALDSWPVAESGGTLRPLSMAGRDRLFVQDRTDILLVNALDGSLLRRFGDRQQAVPIQEGSQAVIAPSVGRLQVVRLGDGEVVATLPARPEGGDNERPSSAKGSASLEVLRALWASPNGEHVVGSYSSGDCAVWSVQAGLPPVVLPHPGLASAIFTSDGQVATVCSDGLCRLWDWRAGTIVDQHDCGGDAISVAMAPGGGRLCIGLRSGDVIVWEPGGKRLCRLPAHRGPVWSIACLDGDRVVSGGTDGRARIWPLDDESLIRKAEESSFRDFTAHELGELRDLLGPSLEKVQERP